ncbi:MAG: bifunctional diaminohydroxyphosphoribosylaminopyrimidine deaminase/5-amino-6-(5-phosphoribosylamino)uracil reductase RibD [Thermoleophilia bacterium]|nr:bifunctional diaminohydroxyphosphoribosylaminopyrimidine deaminase/5-amino-6-(5-phosphoribosylamino)uracil reductase RibD [Thermoleophilia bacterium]
MTQGPTPVELDALTRARRLALNARGRVSPNPLVGAVVLQNGQTVGEGWHEGPGQAHAEVMALADAGERARGATVVCTLEPCSHFGRTPPCTDALRAAGVTRVVVGCLDPLERTRGQGVSILRQSGIDVALADGDDEAACRELNAAFLTAAVRRRPHVMLKLATSLDGKIATADGESRWITGPDSRALVHRWRADVDAVVVGIGTALADDPQLTARDLDGPVRQPMRVVFDSHARLPIDSGLVRTAGEIPVTVFTTEAADEARIDALVDHGVRVLRERGDRPSPLEAMRLLGAEGVQSVLVEGGAVLAAAFVGADAVDLVNWFVAPILIGGADAPGALAGPGFGPLADVPRLQDVETERVGGDILISGRLTAIPGVLDPEEGS